MNPTVALQGTELGPLPFESMESLGARLAWRNGKPLRQLAREIQAQAGRSDWVGLLPQNTTDPGAIGYLCGWRDASEQARRLVEMLRAERYEWLHGGFRFCPICLEAAYHSYLFDWDFIRSCPLHGCALTGNCQHCGTKVGWNTKESILAKAGYRCTHCDNYLSGAEPLLAEHLKFREQSDQIRSRLGPYDEFASRLIAQRGIVLNTWGTLEALRCDRLRPWCNGDQVRRIALYMRCYSSRRTAAARFRGIVSLHWNIRAEVSSVTFPTPRDKPNMLARLLPTYRATLRRLGRWVFSETASEKQACARFRKKGDELVGAWQPKELTYMIFRHVLEGAGFDCAPAGRETMSHFPVQLQYCVLFLRIIRLGARAYFLGLFATIHAILLRHRDWTVQSLFDGSGFPVERFVLVDGAERALKGEEGTAIFPEIEGMPLWPFVRHDKPAYEVAPPDEISTNLLTQSRHRNA